MMKKKMHLKATDPVWYNGYYEIESIVYSIVVALALSFKETSLTVVTNVEFNSPYCLNLIP